MSVRTITCIEVSCQDCGGCGLGDDDYCYTPHFPSLDEARKTLLEANWTWPDDGPRCGECSRRAACRAEGHAMGEWIDCRCGGSRDDHPDGCGVSAPAGGQWRVCERCSTNYERRPVPGDAGPRTAPAIS